MESLNYLEELLLELKDNFQEIEKELEGWKFESRVKRVNGRFKEYFETVPPKNKTPPRFKVSKIMDDLCDAYFRDLDLQEDGRNHVSANSLLAAWTFAIQNGPNQANLAKFKRLFGLLQPFLELFYPNRRSLATYAVEWRKPIKEKYGTKSEVYKQSIYILGISQEESIKMKEDYKESVREKVRGRGEPQFTMQQVYDAIDLTANSTDPIDNIIAIMLACGSRMVEVLKISDYSVPKSSSSSEDVKVEQIKIYKLAKLRGANDDETAEGIDYVTVIRPLLRISADQLVGLVENVRSAYDFQAMSNKTATQKVNAAVNKVMKTLFSIPITGHKCRYLWASLAWQLYGKSVPQAEWVREMYRHASADTTLAYLAYEVAIPKFHVPEELRARVGGLEVDTVNLKEEQKQLKEEVKNVEQELNKQITEASLVDLRFPELANTKRLRLSSAAKLERLRKLDQKYHDVGVRMTQKMAKKYNYGSSVISTYWRYHRPENF